MKTLQLMPMFAMLGMSVSGISFATNGDQMLGANAMQWGMAGAVTGAPQDAAVVFINPAGLSRLEMQEARSDFGFGLLNPPRSINGVESDANLYFIPSGAMAFRAGDDWMVGLGMAGLSGQGMEVPDFLAAPGNQVMVTNKQFFRLAPSLAYKFSDALSAGVSFNLNYQSLALSNPTFTLPQEQGFGWGLNLGMLYKVSDALQLGAAYLTKQNMSELDWHVAAGTYTLDLDGPPMLSLGLGWKPQPDLLIAADIKRIQFSDVIQAPVLNTPAGPSTLAFGWDDQTVFALAVQKTLNEKIDVRAGINYGKSPIEAADVNNNLGSPAITEWHLALGLTRRITPRIHQTFSLAHALENELTASSGPANTIQVSQNLLHFQVSYKY